MSPNRIARRTLALAGMLGLAIGALNASTTSTESAPSLQPHVHVDAVRVCAGEPQPPRDLLVIERDDPDRVRVRLNDALEGTARLRVEANQPVEWLGESAPGVVQLQGTGRDRTVQDLVVRRRNGAPRRVRAQVVILDADGEPVMTVDRVVELDPAPQMAGDASVAVQTGISAGGRPLAVRVPAGAPTPVVEEAAR